MTGAQRLQEETNCKTRESGRAGSMWVDSLAVSNAAPHTSRGTQSSTGSFHR